MTFQTFAGLWRNALDAADFAHYKADQSGAAAPDQLDCVWEMARGGVKSIRAAHGGSQAAFAAAFGMPCHSFENWESGRRTPPDYLPMLLAYAVFSILEERVQGND